MNIAFDFSKDPLENFSKQLARMEGLGIKDFNAFSLATVSKSGHPQVRTVLYKGLIQDALCFFTNYESQKGREMESQPNVSGLFFWSSVFEQLRVDGIVEKISRTESEKYFSSRPRLSQLGAWASQQSSRISGMAELNQKLSAVENKFSGQQVIPCPPNWGGYRIIPQKFEFWFGKEGRLHERYVFERDSAAGPWQRYMLSP